MRTGQRRGHGRRRTEGLTLVEAALVVCIAGVVLAVFVPTFLAHLRVSKVSEAAEELGRLHELSAAYYATVHPDATGRRLRRCLPGAAGPAPPEPSPDPVDVDFHAEGMPGADTWRALGFAPDRPLRYRYTYAPSGEGCNLEGGQDAPLLLLRAEGDLDGDGKRSLFEREATVAEDGTLAPTGILYMLDRVE